MSDYNLCVDYILSKHYPDSPVTKVRYEVKLPAEVESVFEGAIAAELARLADPHPHKISKPEAEPRVTGLASPAQWEFDRGRERGLDVRSGTDIPVGDRRKYSSAFLRGYVEVMAAAPHAPAAKPADPLDVMIDGQKLRWLLSIDEQSRRETNTAAGVVVLIFTPAQRAAVSAHWSAQLRAKVAASEAERRARAPSVMMSVDPEDM